MIKIEQLFIYPVKGCRGVSVDKIQVTPMGLVGDREYALLLDGNRINQNQVPVLVKLSAVYTDGNTLELSFPGKDSFSISTDEPGSISTLSMLGEKISIIKANKISDWLSDALGGQFELVKMEKPIDWNIPLEEFASIHKQKQSKFVDAAPLLLTNIGSLAELNSRLAIAIPMDRFRANVVVSGLSAFEEDTFSEFRFPDANLTRIAVCERCIVTTTDQETGERGKEPLRTLSKYRKRENHYAGGILFGMYLHAENAGLLSVGDSLQVK
ncbi:MAG: MOSC domain-containing protein [Pseudomonadales bacterium]|nr:MOSC domain-containing protein [Pseudomonadales bacterium]